MSEYTGQIIALAVFAVSLLGGAAGSIGYLMFGGWRGTLTIWFGIATVLIALAAVVALATWLGWGPKP